MEKKINIEALERKNPFSVPEGYFEGFASRVMDSIPETESVSDTSSTGTADKKKTKVVGLLPRKKKNGWGKWVAVAACVCGAVFFIANKNGGDADTSSSQLANVKPATPAPAIGNEIETTTASEETPTAGKVYANDSYDISRHVRRSATPAPANITPQPVIRTTPVNRTTSAQMATTKVPAAQPEANAKPQVSSPAVHSTMLATNTLSSSTHEQNSQAANDAYAMEYDMLDYTNMSGTEIYDYLAGNEYY